MNKFSVKKLVLTGLLLGLVIAAQQFRWVNPQIGQMITGSLVNVILIVAAVWVGLSSGLFIAVLSPIFAWLITPGPVMQMLPQLVIVIAAGNIALVVIAWLFRNKNFGFFGVGLALGSAAKAALIWGGMLLLISPMLFGANVPAPMQASLTGFWTIAQWVTPFIGSFIVLLLRPVLNKAIKR